MENQEFNIRTIDFKGEKEGPSIVITGAIHGNEQTGTYTAELIAERLKNEKILGNIRIMPICNESAFKARQRPAVEDGEDLNRIFPGDKNGGYSYRLANRIWELTEGYDYIIDLHCCGIYGSTYTMCWYSKYDFHYDIAKKLGIETVIHTAGTGGQFYLESCEKRGQKGLLIELPGGQPGGVIHMESAESTCEKIINYLKLINIIEGEGIMPEGIKFCGVIAKECLPAHEDGVYIRKIMPGDYVNAGDVVGSVNGVEYKAPFDAVATSSSLSRYVFKGENIISLAPAREVQKGEIE